MIPPLSDLLRQPVTPLPSITHKSFSSFFDTFISSSTRLVLLGDASHGTSEFYAARAEITKRLVSQHGFTVVALESDWPDAEVVDRWVRRRPGPKAIPGKDDEEKPFMKFPTWMWRNREFQDLVDWMRRWNDGVGDAKKKAGVYGLDLYSMGASLHAVVRYLEKVDPKMAAVAKRRYGCLEPWVEDPSQYGLASLRGEIASCEGKVIQALRDLLAKRLEYSSRLDDGEEFHSAEQNAELVADAEVYYKAMYYSDVASWNMRDKHMFSTLQRLLAFKGKNSKAVVWAHNSHLGDARFTEMGRRGELNLGQLCREHFGNAVSIIGCGTHTGTVAAAHEWGDDMEIMSVNPSIPDSYENLAHSTGIPSFVLDLREGQINDELRKALMKDRLERFIGVIYRPATERWSHYSKAVLPRQFDGYIWFDESKAVQSLEKRQPELPTAVGETYPFGY